MTDDFDPTMSAREGWGGEGDPARDPGFTIADTTSALEARSTSPQDMEAGMAYDDPGTAGHDQPAEGGRSEVADIPGADTAQDPSSQG
jgi:hypothetical protein